MATAHRYGLRPRMQEEGTYMVKGRQIGLRLLVQLVGLAMLAMGLAGCLPGQ